MPLYAHLIVDGIEEKDAHTLPAVPPVGSVLRFPSDTKDRERKLRVNNVSFTLDTDTITLFASEL